MNEAIRWLADPAHQPASPGDCPRCAKCRNPWGSLESQQSSPWCTQCVEDYPDEFPSIFSTHVMKRRAFYLCRAGVPAKFQGCGLDNYLGDDSIRRRALEDVQAWSAGATGSGLFLSGPSGVGKTHLAVAALLELIARRKSARYLAVHELLVEARESYSDRAKRPLSAILNSCTETSAVLLLDDLAAEKSTEFARETFLTIVDRAYGKRWPILLVTSNFDLNAIGKRLDERIADRLRELCAVVKIAGLSYRRRLAATREGRGAQISGGSPS